MSDYDGDGNDDFIVLKQQKFEIPGQIQVRHERTIIYYSRDDGTSFDPHGITDRIPLVGIGSPSPSFPNIIGKNYFFPGDFNGDGRQDFIIFLDNDPKQAYITFPALSIYNESIWFENYVMSPPWLERNIPTSLWNADKIFVIDFDGDGKQELMAIKDDNSGSDIYSVVLDVRAGNNKYLLKKIRTLSYPNKQYDVFTGDFNGDFKTDILTLKNCSDPNCREISYSNGKTFIRTNFGLYPLPNYIDYGGYFLADKFAVGDFNGDGKSDILHSFGEAPIEGTNTMAIALYYYRGASITTPGYFHREEYDFDTYFDDDYPLFTADINGDGRIDVINRRGEDYPMNFLFFKKQGRENLLEKVVDGIGNYVKFSYKHLTADENGSPDFHVQGSSTLADYPLNHIQPGMFAISSVTVPDGVGGDNVTSYSYEDARLHLQGRGFLGFKKIHTKNSLADIKTITEYTLNTEYYSPTVCSVKTYLLSNNSLISTTAVDNEFVWGLEDGTNSGGIKSFLALSRTTEETNHITSVVTTTNLNFDRWGNITASTKSIKPVSSYSNTETVSTYTGYGRFGTIFPSKPFSISTKKMRNGQPSYTEITGYPNYNNQGSLLSKTEYANKPGKAVSTTYTYDDFGNLTSEMITAATHLPTMGYSLTYNDPNKRYPDIKENIIDQEQLFEYDPLWGKPITVTGIDGISTEYEYDEWGRLKNERVKAGITGEEYEVETHYDWDIDEDLHSVYFVHTEHPGAPDVKIWYDILGREVYRETEGFDGDWLKETTVYNPDGTVDSKIKDGGDVLTNTYTYNAYKQVLTETSDFFGTTEYDYTYTGGNTKVEITNPAGQTSYTVTDPAGKVIESGDNGGALTFEYDALGNQISVKAGSTLLVFNRYDICGRQTELWDVNGGKTQYQYNAYGQLKKQTDANNNMHDMLYDAMGRMWKKIGPEGETEYTFVTSGDGINQVEKIEGFNGNDVEYEYDGLGRVTVCRQT